VSGGRRRSKTGFPPGWDERRIKKVLACYEARSESEAAAEHVAAFATQGQTVMGVPSDLVAAVRELIAKRSNGPEPSK
jgi:hypothetical protein